MAFTSEELREHHRARFESGNPDLDTWLRDSALHASEMNTRRTFAWHAGDRIVVAYFTSARISLPG